MSFVYEDISDLSYVKHITLDLSGGVSHKFVSAKQGDINTRYLGISLTANDVPIEIPSDIVPRIRATKPDGNCVFNDGDLHDNKIYIELTDQILAVSGTVKCDIGMYRGDDVLSSATFFLEVAERPLDEDRIKSSGEFLALEKYVQEAKEAATASRNKPTFYSGTDISSPSPHLTIAITDLISEDSHGNSIIIKHPYKVGDIYLNIDEERFYQCVKVTTDDEGNFYLWKGLNYAPDIKYNAQSENAQSGKAVAEVEKNIKQTSSPAIRKKVTGEAISVRDVGSVEHELDIKLTSNTTTAFSNVKVGRYGKNLYDWKTDLITNGNGELQEDGSIRLSYPLASMSKNCGWEPFDPSQQITISFDMRTDVTDRANSLLNQVSVYLKIEYTDGATTLVGNGGTDYSKYNTYKATSDANKEVKKVSWYYNYADNTYIKDLQIEIGDTATDYESYIESQIVTADADGTVKGLTSVSPNMTVLCNTADTSVNVTYNVSPEKYIAENTTKKIHELVSDEALGVCVDDIQYNARNIFAEEVNKTVKDVFSHMNSDGIAFAFVTDMHYVTHGNNYINAEQGKAMISDTCGNIKSVCDRIPLDAILVGGDLIMPKGTANDVDSLTQENMNSYINDIRSKLLVNNVPVLMTPGNHDGVDGGAPNPESLYSSMMRHNNSYVVRNGKKPYYYMDFTNQKIRIIALNTINADGNHGVSDEEYAWLQNTLNGVPNGYDVLVFSHIGIQSIDFEVNTQNVKDLLNSWHNDTNNGNIIAYVAGHQHYDWIVPKEYNGTEFKGSGCDFPVILTTCSYNSSQTPSAEYISAGVKVVGTRTPNTVLQDAWDVFVYNKEEKKLYITRFGAGDDRVVGL